MKCVVANANLGIWCRCIHSLAQVGDEDIYFDCSDTILTVSTFNQSLSNYATFLFFRNFFSSYQMTSDEPEKMVINTKIMLKPYRTLRIAKNYLSSELQYTPNQDYFTVKSESRSHASSTYKLGCSSTTDEIQFECDPYALKNYLKADAKVLSSCLSNFTHVKGLAELTLKIHGNKVTLKNTVTDIARKDGSVVTEYNLTSYDFLDYEVHDDDIELSFGFREFKVFTTVAEQLKLPISIHFQGQTDPVIIIVKGETFESRLCMATRIQDPFANIGRPSVSASEVSSGTNGAINSVTTQGSSRNVSQEVHRRQQAATFDRVLPSAVQTPDAPPPPTKKLRRTDFRNPEPEEIIDLDVDHNPTAGIEIVPLVEKLSKRSGSKVYRSLHRVATGPRLTSEEYLTTVPGNDVVLCPDSDDEN